MLAIPRRSLHLAHSVVNVLFKKGCFDSCYISFGGRINSPAVTVLYIAPVQIQASIDHQSMTQQQTRTPHALNNRARHPNLMHKVRLRPTPQKSSRTRRSTEGHQQGWKAGIITSSTPASSDAPCTQYNPPTPPCSRPRPPPPRPSPSPSPCPRPPPPGAADSPSCPSSNPPPTRQTSCAALPVAAQRPRPPRCCFHRRRLPPWRWRGPVVVLAAARGRLLR